MFARSAVNLLRCVVVARKFVVCVGGGAMRNFIADYLAEVTVDNNYFKNKCDKLVTVGCRAQKLKQKSEHTFLMLLLLFLYLLKLILQ